MSGVDGSAFTQCHQVNLVTSLSDRKVFEEHPASEEEVIKIATDAEGACSGLRYFTKDNHHHHVMNLKLDTTCRVVAKSPGFSTIRASYGRFGDEIKIGAFRPLTAVQPAASDGIGEILLAVEASVHVVWSGGPEPWVDSPESHFHRLRVHGKSIFLLKFVRSSEADHILGPFQMRA